MAFLGKWTPDQRQFLFQDYFYFCFDGALTRGVFLYSKAHRYTGVLGYMLKYFSCGHPLVSDQVFVISWLSSVYIKCEWCKYLSLISVCIGRGHSHSDYSFLCWLCPCAFHTTGCLQLQLHLWKSAHGIFNMQLCQCKQHHLWKTEHGIFSYASACSFTCGKLHVGSF